MMLPVIIVVFGLQGNSAIAVLTFAPVACMLMLPVMLVVLGFKGSAWAWRNKRWQSIDHFRRVQRKWAIWGVGVWGASIAFSVGLFFLLMSIFMNSEAYKMAVTLLENHSEAIKALGAPIKTGFPWGNITTSGPQGHANIQFSATGPDADGTVYLDATKDFGRWRINRMELEIRGRVDRISLAGGAPRVIRTVPYRQPAGRNQ
jgi:hypothetical protein